MSHPLPPKKEVALALLERSRVHIHLDPRKGGVIVPVGFKKQPQLVLEIGLNMPVPIPDLRLDDEGMTCTLSFSRTPFYCVVPWPCVFAMVGDDGRGMVWPDDVPPEIAAQASVRPVEAAPKPRAATAKRAPLEAVASPPPSADDKPKGRKAPRSKKPRVVAVESEPERPVLVALPAPAERRGPRAVPSQNQKKKAPAPQRPSAGRTPSHPTGHSTGQGQGTSQGKGGKRELPPYLRVVK